MSTPFVGQIALFGFPFAPSGWAFCDGRLLAIASNTALFSLIGATYGGDGIRTFGLPDLRGRVPMSAGTGPGLSPYVLGQADGVEQESLSVPNLPSHSHTATLHIATGGRPVAPISNNYLESNASLPPSPAPTLVALNPAEIVVASTGNGLPLSLLQPYLAVNFCIALLGIFPSRD